jgi:hypothetical protein
MSGLGAVLSAFMNNVAALALLMPVDMGAARKEGRSPALTLMPLSFATILGGLITLIGTPPNIIIAAYRQEACGESFARCSTSPRWALSAPSSGVPIHRHHRLAADPGRARTKGRQRQGTDDSLHGYIAELVVPETYHRPSAKEGARSGWRLQPKTTCAVVGPGPPRPTAARRRARAKKSAAATCSWSMRRPRPSTPLSAR